MLGEMEIEKFIWKKESLILWCHFSEIKTADLCDDPCSSQEGESDYQCRKGKIRDTVNHNDHSFCWPSSDDDSHYSLLFSDDSSFSSSCLVVLPLEETTLS